MDICDVTKMDACMNEILKQAEGVIQSRRPHYIVHLTLKDLFSIDAYSVLLHFLQTLGCLDLEGRERCSTLYFSYLVTVLFK